MKLLFLKIIVQQRTKIPKETEKKCRHLQAVLD